MIVNSIPQWTHYVDQVIAKCAKESDVHFDCGGKRYSIALELSPLLYVTFKEPEAGEFTADFYKVLAEELNLFPTGIFD